MKIKTGKRLKTQQKDILYIISLARGEQSIGDGCSRADGAVNFGSHIEETAVPSGSRMHISASFFIYRRRAASLGLQTGDDGGSRGLMTDSRGTGDSAFVN